MQKTKVCKKCNVNKELNDANFPVRKSSKDGYRNECKVCMSEYGKKYYQSNRETIIKHNSEYRKNNWEAFTENRIAYELKNEDRLREWREDYYKKNKVEILRKSKLDAQKNKEKYASYYLNWARNNVDKTKAKRHKRDARLRNLPYTLTLSEWQENLDFFNGVCAYCGSAENIEKEHFIPLNKGGGYTKQNIIPACSSCNSSKQDSEFLEWYKRQEHFDLDKVVKITGFLYPSIQTSTL